MHWDDDLENATGDGCPPMDPESQTWTDYFIGVADVALCVANHIEWNVILETSDREAALLTMKEKLGKHRYVRLRKRERTRREAAAWWGLFCRVRQIEEWQTIAEQRPTLDELSTFSKQDDPLD